MKSSKLNINIERLQHNFQKIKKSIKKKFPDAVTRVDENGNYFIADGNGRLLKDLELYPSQENVYDAWYVADHAIKVEKIIERNSERFSDDKIYKSMEKE